MVIMLSVWLMSNETYNHILFNIIGFISCDTVYPYTFICYTYGKTLLNLGTQLEYVALSNQTSLDYRSLFRIYLPQIIIINGYMIQDIETLSISTDINI
ncbi:unnamed protein product [Rotaria magnacalcarata]|uniref:Uncharacterized protein n=1 Tax=Rotaria magnacalcarata TaxID=392030 RepID=A0A820SV97_9BILA|nr:unnamed protein product [Rotaria magnacalcarata]CAF4337255.1 unnamed protein product [Rotaria magnacalcarata]CAF4458675.1 unnamed protein product [Rotaria magnacalcarata]CAF5076680.1 unnamed protein product [Rotaria magnacalcarata]CAF5097193.1 unnamed protein product [Rotaria magnacalcarata]